MSCSRLAACCLYDNSLSGSSPARRDGLFSICSRVKYHLFFFPEREICGAAITKKETILKIFLRHRKHVSGTPAKKTAPLPVEFKTRCGGEGGKVRWRRRGERIKKHGSSFVFKKWLFVITNALKYELTVRAVAFTQTRGKKQTNKASSCVYLLLYYFLLLLVCFGGTVLISMNINPV